MLRLIKKWLKAEVIEDGESKTSEEGSPQGSSISPFMKQSVSLGQGNDFEAEAVTRAEKDTEKHQESSHK
jgi:hypothetical protein